MSWFGSIAPCLAKTSDARQQGGPGVDSGFFIPVPPVPHPTVHGHAFAVWANKSPQTICLPEVAKKTPQTASRKKMGRPYPIPVNKEYCSLLAAIPAGLSLTGCSTLTGCNDAAIPKDEPLQRSVLEPSKRPVFHAMSLELGYWGIRGLGAPLRMMLTYAGVYPATRKMRTRCSAKDEKERAPPPRTL